MKNYKNIIPLTENMLSVEHFSTLRALGRYMGVKTPTAKSKGELIRDMLAIQDGSLSPEKPNIKGAKVKSEVSIDKFFVKEEVEREKGCKLYTEDKDCASNKLVFADIEAEFNVSGYFRTSFNGVFGFVRASKYGETEKDVYVSGEQLKKYGLKEGDLVQCKARLAADGTKPILVQVVSINGAGEEQALSRANFDSAVPLYPCEKLVLSNKNDNTICKMIDVFAPIGKGQRGLIVGQNKTGKTIVLKDIACAIEQNYSNIKMFLLLLGERPEEVTDFSRAVNCEIIAPTVHITPRSKVFASEMLIARAKRLVENGEDVVILVDSIDKLCKAYGALECSACGAQTSTVEIEALIKAKRFFSQARNLENSGSLTIIATLSHDVDCNEEHIVLKELKELSNMEVHLCKRLAEKKMFPPIDALKCSTAKEELLIDKTVIEKAGRARKKLAQDQNANETLIEVIINNSDLSAEQCLDKWLNTYDK